MLLSVRLIVIWYLKAARYSTSPMGGSRPPVKATLTVNPTPGPLPTCRQKHACDSQSYVRDKDKTLYLLFSWSHLFVSSFHVAKRFPQCTGKHLAHI